jgi:hypothetical protein
MRRVILVSVALVVLAGCTSPSGTEVPPTELLIPSTETPTALPATATETPPGELVLASATPAAAEADLQFLIGAVLADLAGELAVSADEIGVVDIEEMTWADQSLGCTAVEATPADSAEQVAGYRILLGAKDAVYEYHTDSEQHFVACETGAAVSGEPVLQVDPVISALVDLASRNLAERLELPQRRVFLVGVTAYDWPDNTLGCATDNQVAGGGPVPGYQIVLRVGRQDYFYHTDYRQAVFCPEEAERLPELAPGSEATEEP